MRESSELRDDEAPDDVTRAIAVAVAAREAERYVADEMARAGRTARMRRRLQLVGLPASRVDQMINAAERTARDRRPPGRG